MGNCWPGEYFEQEAGLITRLLIETQECNDGAMSNPMEKYFEELRKLGERVLEQTMCDVCQDEFPDEEQQINCD